MMKKAGKFLVVALALTISIMIMGSVKAKAGDIEDLESLINKGLSISDESSPDVYIWISDVQAFIEKYPDVTVFSYTKTVCYNAKVYGLSYSNSKNKILGTLLYAKAQFNNEPIKMPLELVGIGASITDEYSSDAYKWILDVMDTNNLNPDSSVYSDLKKASNNAWSYGLSYDNSKNRIIANLSMLDNEVIITSSFTELTIVKSPDETDYVEGEYFDPTGTELNAVFVNTYKDGSTKTIQKPVSDYVVDTTTKLKTSNTKWTYSYTYEGVTKTVSQDISVAKFVPELVSTTLESISVVSKPKKTEYLIGESFNPKGLKVNAKYKNTWSDGSTTYTTSKSVAYTVDDVTPLAKSDKKWTISYYDNGVTVKTTVKIKVKSSDPTISSTKVTLTPGDTTQLRVYGTEKYVMWQCDKNDIISLSDNGTIKALTAGSVKVTATIGSGKKNVKLTCTVKVSPKVYADKKVIFINNDEYETLKIKTSKKKKVSYKVTSDSYVKLVDEGNGIYEVLPNGNYLFGNCNSSITITSYDENGWSYVEQKIPVFIYGDSSAKTVTLSTRVNYKVDKSFSSAEFYFDGNRSALIYDEKVYKQLKKNAKKVETVYSRYDIEISKENFEKIMTKALKAGTVVIYGITN